MVIHFFELINYPQFKYEFIRKRHSLALTIIMLIQTKIYKHSTRLARWTKILISSILTSLFLSFILYTLEFIKFHQILLFLSFYKILLTSIKYTPQLLLNFKKKSTEGWSIANSLLDLAGGVFSILQSGVDAYLMGDEGLIYVMNVSMIHELIYYNYF